MKTFYCDLINFLKFWSYDLKTSTTIKTKFQANPIKSLYF